MLCLYFLILLCIYQSKSNYIATLVSKFMYLVQTKTDIEFDSINQPPLRGSEITHKDADFLNRENLSGILIPSLTLSNQVGNFPLMPVLFVSYNIWKIIHTKQCNSECSCRDDMREDICALA